MSIYEQVIDKIKNNYKIPKKIKVTSEMYNWLMTDSRIQRGKISNTDFPNCNSIPIVIDDKINGSYEIEY